MVRIYGPVNIIVGLPCSAREYFARKGQVVNVATSIILENWYQKTVWNIGRRNHNKKLSELPKSTILHTMAQM
jgi:hypothetical protein